MPARSACAAWSRRCRSNGCCWRPTPPTSPTAIARAGATNPRTSPPCSKPSPTSAVTPPKPSPPPPPPTPNASSTCPALEQDLEGLGGGGEGEGAGDVGGGAEAGAAVELEGGLPVQVRAHAADAAVGLRVLHVLQRVHRGH